MNPQTDSAMDWKAEWQTPGGQEYRELYRSWLAAATDREQALEEARVLHGRLRLASSVSRWKAFMADALLEAKAQGWEGASRLDSACQTACWQECQRRAAELRAQKAGGK